MLTTTGHRLPGAPGRLVTETAAWGAMIVLVAISYVVAGTSGLLATVGGRAFTTIAESTNAGGFDNQLGSLSLLIVFALSCAGLFIPGKVFATRSPAVRKVALSIAAIVEAVLLIVLSLAPSAWLTWVAALFLGAVIGLLMSISPFTNEKPWRRVGIPAAVLVFASCAFQILGGSAAGSQALGWVSLLVGIGMAAGSVIIFLTPERALHAETATTGQFPELRAKAARPAESIANPWVCVGLFAVLGATFILAQPTAISHGYGQAGFALIIACCLVGWVIGFEMGPTFAPGMSRPRVSTFALLVSGVLLLATGGINELSGKVVLSAAIAFLVGVGVRAQPYEFRRRYGAVGGAGLAIIINAFDLGGVVVIGSSPDWFLAPSDVAFLILGVAALVAGIIGLFTFDPHKLQGLSVDIVHGFRPPSSPVSSAGSLGNSAERLGTGFFIAVEGGDGSGKTTQIKRISAALADDGYHVEATREPGGTEVGNRIRSVLFDAEPPSPRAEALLFAADRAHHVASLVDPSLEAGNIVITDRYIDSTIAYQAAGRSFDEKTILALSRWATQGLVPHLTIVLDIEPETAAERMGKRGENNYLDEEDRTFHQRVRQTYLSRAHKEPDRYVVLDASVGADELTDRILEAVRTRLPKARVERDGTPAEVAGAQPSEFDSQSSSEPSSEEPPVETSEPGTRFVPASEERFSPAAPVTGDDDEDFEGVPTERVDLGADLRGDGEKPDESSASAGVTAGLANNDAGEVDQDSETSPESASAGDAPVVGTAPVAEATDPDEHDSEDHDEHSVLADEAATTVLPVRGGVPPSALTGDEHVGSDPSDVIDTGDPEEAETRVVRQVDPDDAETTVLPVRSAREMSRERLQAQAEIERQARERLRRQRERNNRRFSDPEGN